MKTKDIPLTNFHGMLNGFYRSLNNQADMPADFTLKQLTEILVDKYRADASISNMEMANNIYSYLWATIASETIDCAFRFTNTEGKITLEIPDDCIYL